MAEEVKNGGAVLVTQGHGANEDAGTAVIVADAVQNPGLPPHRMRITDLNPKKAKTAERVVYTLFYVSVLGSIGAVLAYMFLPIESGEAADIRLHTMITGAAMALSMLALGIGAVHWAKTLMAGHESVEERHPTPSSQEVREASSEVFRVADEESGFSRRTLVRNSLIGALIAFPLPGIAFMRSLAPQNQDPVVLLKHTLWDQGVRLHRDGGMGVVGAPIHASDVTIGSVFHVVPGNLHEGGHMLDEKAKAVVLLMRLDPSRLNPRPERADWAYDGMVAYSKVCTHVGCPVALYEQHTHHLLCPCHQSQFDVAQEAKVIFGPAKRPLPQLPITVDDEGYLIAQSDFTEPVGPSFWERLKS